MALASPSWPDVDATKDTSFTMPPRHYVPDGFIGVHDGSEESDAGTSLGQRSYTSFPRYEHTLPDSVNGASSPVGSRSPSPSPDAMDFSRRPDLPLDNEAVLGLPSGPKLPSSIVGQTDNLTSPPSVAHSFDASSYLRAISSAQGTRSRNSSSPTASLPRPLSPAFMISRSASGMDLVANKNPTPLINVIDHDKDEENARPYRSVRFKSRVRISSGTHPHYKPHPHLPNPYDITSTLSRSSSVSDSSSISAPLRPALDDYFPTLPHTSTTDQTFSPAELEAWLSRNGLASQGDWRPDADETTALIIHRKRRGAPHEAPPPGSHYRSSRNAYGQVTTKIVSPTKQGGRYGSVGNGNDGGRATPRGRSRSTSASVRSRRRRKAMEGNRESWDWGAWNPMVWWAGLRTLFCLGPPPQEQE